MASLTILTPTGKSSLNFILHQAPANCGCKILGHPTWSGQRSEVVARIMVAALFDYRITESVDKGNLYNQPYKRGQILFSYSASSTTDALVAHAGGLLLPPAKGMYGDYDIIWGMWRKEDYPLVLPDGYTIEGVAKEVIATSPEDEEEEE